MKSKKKRVNSFKNWLLARDSASRISTFPQYNSFLENSKSFERNRSQIMDLFDSIIDSKYFYKFNQIMNSGYSKDANQGKINIQIRNKDLVGGILDFIECFNIQTFEPVFIKIELVEDTLETIVGEGETTDHDDKKAKFIYAHIPYSFDDKKIVSESKKAIEYWINSIDFKDDLANKFFKWWMQNYIFVQEKYSNFLKSFESAFVEWLRTISPEEAGDAYLKIINNSTDTSIRRRTDLGAKEIIDHINQGIKEFNIPIEDVKKGSNLLRRFD